MTPEISELVRALEEFQANEPGFPQIFIRAAATLSHLSELSAEYLESLRLCMDQRGDADRRATAAETRLAEAIALLDEAVPPGIPGTGSFLEWQEKRDAFLTSVSGSTEEGNG